VKRLITYLCMSLVLAVLSGSLLLRRHAAASSGSAVPIPVKVMVVANFEPGADMGDAPGEFQFWAEREHLDEVIPIKGALRPLRRNKAGLYGIVWGNTDKLLDGATEGLMALVLDPRFDFRRTYWLFTGTSGVDPRVASVGSAAWARWVVNGDTLREFDDRQIPKGWPYGLFAIGASRPDQLPVDPHSYSGMTSADTLSAVYDLNQGLGRWAFGLTRDVPIPDAPQLAESRKLWKGFPNAQRPPFVLMGETLGSLRYWHGSRRTRWAEDWVKLWTHGKGVFTMTNSESQQMASGMNVLAKAGLVDLQRVLVLRTASNTCEPPPGVSPTATIGDEGPGQITAFEANYRVGAPVVHELLSHWSKYENAVPSAP